MSSTERDDSTETAIKHNDGDLDRPWAWLVRVPCMTAGKLGNPYPGTAELRVVLPNHEKHPYDPILPDIHIHGLYPFGPLAESSKAETVGMFMIDAKEARALGEALIAAADKVGTV